MTQPNILFSDNLLGDFGELCNTKTLFDTVSVNKLRTKNYVFFNLELHPAKGAKTPEATEDTFYSPENF